MLKTARLAVATAFTSALAKALTTALVTALLLAAPAVQAYPDKTITLVVPYAPGGSTDVLARVLADNMARDLGQQVIVDNTAGAGGTIGTAKVTRSPNDGHTLLFHNMGIATAPALYSKLSYDVARDLDPVGALGEVPMILVRSKSFAPASLSDLVRLMKAKPGEVRFAHAGVGSTSHLCAMLLNQSVSTNVNMIPYKGTGPALLDLVAGNVDLICDQPVSTGAHLQSGALKPLAMATRERVATLPEVPTFAESGLPGFELAVWHGIWAPKGTPAAVIDRVNKALRSALAAPAVVKRFGEMGVMVPPAERLNPDWLRQHTTAELKRWEPVIKAAGAKAE